MRLRRVRPVRSFAHVLELASIPCTARLPIERSKASPRLAPHCARAQIAARAFQNCGPSWAIVKPRWLRADSGDPALSLRGSDGLRERRAVYIFRCRVRGSARLAAATTRISLHLVKTSFTTRAAQSH